jgi:hypothetical protein
MMTGNNVKLNQAFPASVGGGVGGVLKLSQTQCALNPASCCNKKGTICTNWTGAHLVRCGNERSARVRTHRQRDHPLTLGLLSFVVRACCVCSLQRWMHPVRRARAGGCVRRATKRRRLLLHVRAPGVASNNASMNVAI